MKRTRPMQFIYLFFFGTLFVTGNYLHAQEQCAELPFIRGLRVYGGMDETNLPVFYTGGGEPSSPKPDLPGFITIRFDVMEPLPPDLQIVFRHCDKDWNIDTDYFVRDEFFTRTRQLFFEDAPPSVLHYLWRFTNHFPSERHPFIRFLYSGNWLFDIVDPENEEIIYASGRFICVEDRVASEMAVFNDYWTEWDAPFDQVHRVTMRVGVPEDLFGDFVRTVDFYKNHNLYRQYRVDHFDFEPNTRIEGVGRVDKKFTYLNIQPGNSYRLYDFMSPGRYVMSRTVFNVNGPDFTRYRFPVDRMTYFGSGETMPATSWDADYMCVRFELIHPKIRDRDVFVAGQFNDWDPREEDRMMRDPESGNYVVYKWLFRGAYDYQYVLGRYDEDLGYVVEQDWSYLEGNSWSAQNLYWGIVYYDDDKFGGVHRAVGFSFVTTGQ